MLLHLNYHTQSNREEVCIKEIKLFKVNIKLNIKKKDIASVNTIM